MGLAKAYDELTNNPELSSGATLPIGEALVDDDDVERVLIPNSLGTRILDGDGKIGLNTDVTFGGGSLQKYSDGSIIYDDDGEFIAAKYLTSTSGNGTVQFNSASIDVTSNNITGNDGSLELSGTPQLNNFGGGTFTFTGPSGSPVLVDASQNQLVQLNDGGPVSVQTADIQIDEGQSIQDDNGTTRFDIDADFTTVSDETGRTGIALIHEIATQHRAYSGQPFRIRDEEGGFNAMDYITSATTPGELKLSNADINMANNEIRWPGIPARIYLKDFNTIAIETDTDDSSGDFEVRDGFNDTPRLTVNNGGPVEVNNSNLKINEGQSIQDNGGLERLFIGTQSTQLKYQDGENALYAGQGNALQLQPNSSTPFEIFDDEGGFTSVKYTTSASAPGTLSLDNAEMDFHLGGGTNSPQTQYKLSYEDGGTSHEVKTTHDSGSGTGFGNNSVQWNLYNHPGEKLLELGADAGLQVHSGDILIDEGQSIQDGNNIARVEINSDSTYINDETSQARFIARSGVETQVVPDSNSDWRVFDAQGGFQAYRYNSTASAPGTLQLSNARIKSQQDNGDVYVGQRPYTINPGLSINRDSWNSGDEFLLSGLGTDSAPRVNFEYYDDSTSSLTNVLKINGDGLISIPNGDLQIDGGKIITAGTGSHELDIYDTSESESLMKFVEGGGSQIEVGRDLLFTGAGTERGGIQAVSGVTFEDADSSGSQWGINEQFSSGDLIIGFGNNTYQTIALDESGIIDLLDQTAVFDKNGLIEFNNQLQVVNDFSKGLSVTGKLGGVANVMSLQNPEGTANDEGVSIDIDSGGDSIASLQTIRKDSGTNSQFTIKTRRNGSISTALRVADTQTVSVVGGNFQIPEGSVMQDDNGDQRITFDPGATFIHNNDTDIGIEVGDTSMELRAYSGQPIKVIDELGSFNAVQYDPASSSPGTMNFNNANIDMNSQDITSVGEISATDGTFTGVVDVSNDGTILRLNSQTTSTDALIEFTQSLTSKFDFGYKDSTDGLTVYGYSSTSDLLSISDGNPGALLLRNANLDMLGGYIKAGAKGADGRIEWPIATNDDQTARVVGDTNGSGVSQVAAEDGLGNTTQLT